MQSKLIFSALSSSPNYRLYVGGQLLSNIGTLIESIALSWLVYRLTHSGLYVGILFFINQITIFFCSPITGILSDRIQRYKLLVWSNTCAALVSLTLGIAVLFGLHSLWYILLTQIVAGFAKGIDNPVRNTIVNDLIEKPEHLVNAMSFGSLIASVAVIIGPTIAAFLIPWKGEGICFVVNSFCYLAFVTSLLLIKHKPHVKSISNINIIKDIKEGFDYCRSYSPIRTVIVFVGLMGLSSFSINVVMPIYAKEILKGGADTFGFITTYSGFGALIGAILIASRRNALGLDFIIFIATLLYSIGFLLLSLVSSFVASAVIMVFVGFGQVLIFTAASSILQTLASNNKIGIVIGFHYMFFMACSTIGSLLVGKLTDSIGTLLTMQLISSIAILFCLAYGTQIKTVRRKSIKRFLLLGIDPILLKNQW